MSRLVLVCGLPGAGKTVAAARLAAERGALWFSPDTWMLRLGFDGHDEQARAEVEGLQQELAFELLRHGQDVVLDNGFWTREERDGIRSAVRSAGHEVELCVLDVPFEELWRRVEARNRAGGPGTIEISREQLESYLPWFQLPGPDELALYDTAPSEAAPSEAAPSEAAPSEAAAQNGGSSGGLGSVV